MRKINSTKRMVGKRRERNNKENRMKLPERKRRRG